MQPEIKISKVINCTSVSAFKCNPCKFNLELLLGLFFRPLIRKLLAILGLKSKVLCFSAKPRLPWIFLTLTKVPMLLSTRTWSKWGQSFSEFENLNFNPISYFLALIWLGFFLEAIGVTYLMANIWEKVISILAGNLNSGGSYLITAVPVIMYLE